MLKWYHGPIMRAKSLDQKQNHERPRHSQPEQPSHTLANASDSTSYDPNDEHDEPSQPHDSQQSPLKHCPASTSDPP